MSVLIKGMKMPKKCNECPLHFYEGQAICSCRALHAIDDDEILKPWKNKRKDCPLVPVPPHGDLIDRDGIKWIEEEFEERCHNDRWKVVEKIAYKAQVDKLPTVIPTDG